MSVTKSSPETIDEYIAAFSTDVQAKLLSIRAEVKSLAPHAVEKICYGIPTFSMSKNIFHFAAFKGHIGLYPGPAAIESLATELECYKTSKGAVQIPLNQDLPLPLIRKLVIFNLERLAAPQPNKRRK